MRILAPVIGCASRAPVEVGSGCRGSERGEDYRDGVVGVRVVWIWIRTKCRFFDAAFSKQDSVVVLVLLSWNRFVPAGHPRW